MSNLRTFLVLRAHSLVLSPNNCCRTSANCRSFGSGHDTRFALHHPVYVIQYRVLTVVRIVLLRRLDGIVTHGIGYAFGGDTVVQHPLAVCAARILENEFLTDNLGYRPLMLVDRLYGDEASLLHEGREECRRGHIPLGDLRLTHLEELVEDVRDVVADGRLPLAAPLTFALGVPAFGSKGA